jgi:nucleoside-diphosphate kinase
MMSEGQERTLVIIKPDAVERGIVGEIIHRFEQDNIKPLYIKMLSLDKETAGLFYAEHKERPFFAELVDYMTSGTIVVMMMEGEDCVARVRTILGNTDPAKADKGTIRRDFGISKGKNSVHASDSMVSAKRELAIFFDSDEEELKLQAA